MSQAKYILIATPKGGVGKSTITMNLGRALQLAKKSVLVVDLDPDNHTSINYSRLWSQSMQHLEDAGEPPLPPVVQLGTFSVPEMDRVSGNSDIVLMDSAAANSMALGKYARVADLVIVPITLARADLLGGLEFASTMAVLSAQRGGRPLCRILLNEVNTRRASTTAEITELTQQMALPAPLFSTLIPEREAVRTAGNRGITVFDHPPARVVAEQMRALAKEVIALLKTLPDQRSQ